MTQIQQVTTPPKSPELALFPDGRISGSSLPTLHWNLRRCLLRAGAWLTFQVPTYTTRLAYRRSTSLGPCFSHPTFAIVIFRPFCVCRPFVSDFLLCFLRPYTCNNLLHLQGPYRSYYWFFFFTSMAAKGSSSRPLRVILMPHEYKEYLHLT